MVPLGVVSAMAIVVAQNAIARLPDTAAIIAPSVILDAVLIFILCFGYLEFLKSQGFLMGWFVISIGVHL